MPVTWSASDDESLRSFDLHGSYDGGRTWHLIAGNLPGSARSFSWQTAPGSGFANLRVRVVAHDLRFQNSSSTISSGTTPPTTPTPTPAPTATPTPAPDTVTITRAEYTKSKQLRVDATSTQSTAVLKAYVTSSGALIGTLTNNGSGRYSGQWSWSTNPQNVTVGSSLGGSATRSVTAK